MSSSISLPYDPSWTMNKFLNIHVENTSEYMTNVHVTFFTEQGYDTAEYDGRDYRVNVCVRIFPHLPIGFSIPLSVCSGKKLFLPRTPGRFKAGVQGANIQLEDVVEIRVHHSKGGEDCLNIKSVKVDDQAEILPLPDIKLVDELHQWKTKDWEGKAKSLNELTEILETELAAAVSTPESYPESWSKFGGSKKIQFEATGFFRTEHDGKRWWLVDPEGCAFWSIGVDCVRLDGKCNTSGIEDLFDPPLPSREVAPHLYDTAKAKYDNQDIFLAAQHNLERALGTDWEEKWLTLTRNRLLGNRFNTIGNWSDDRIKTGEIPYVFTMQGFPSSDKTLFRDFPDVFCESYQQESEKWARQLQPVANNPWVIGYFMCNEPEWGFLKGYDLGKQLLMSEDSASKQVLLQKLQEKFANIAELNSTWDSQFSSWNDFDVPRTSKELGNCHDDTFPFTEIAVEQLVKIPALACKQVASNHLNLGLRWSWIHSDYQFAASEYLDVFSFNCYQLKPDPDLVKDIAQRSGKPVIIGEYHIGSLDKGLPAGGIHNTRTMQESVNAYRYYVENAASLPDLVGAHYFQYCDQHVMGRFDGENMQIGMTDVTSRPYQEWQASREIHENLYEIAAHQAVPYKEEPKTIPNGTLAWQGSFKK